jgi:hypothetical protein
MDPTPQDLCSTYHKARWESKMKGGAPSNLDLLS